MCTPERPAHDTRRVGVATAFSVGYGAAMPFASILGHEQVIAGLRSAFERGRVAHAYLFAGPDGVGKARVAEAFVQLLSCKEPAPGPDACGRCRPCRLIADGRHPDLITVRRDGQFIKIEQVRELTKGLRFPPVEAATRAVVIHDAEALHLTAANALLKTLEEPSPRNVFVLVTSQPNVLLTTIRSRSQQVRFTALSRELVAGWLVREKGVDPTTADELAAMSGGSLGAAEKLVDTEVSAIREQWLGELATIGTLRPTQLLALGETLAAVKEKMPAVLDVMRSALRDAMLKSGGLPDDRLTFRGRRLPVLDGEAALSALTLIDEAERALSGNVNPRLVAEHLLLGLRRAAA